MQLERRRLKLKSCRPSAKAYLPSEALPSWQPWPREMLFGRNWKCGLEIATLHADIRFSHAADGRWRAEKRAVSSVDIMEVTLTLR
ncbi:hypothetical protein [Rhizobium sp. NPDC090279]|uniref:hypothetical protein n=1 Tax=Rhizobium sp. NPDC090279 TaxID=3364499 RepID=UPI00383ADE0B